MTQMLSTCTAPQVVHECPPNGESSSTPPRTAAVLTTVCAAATLSGWWLGPSNQSVYAFGVAYLAGGAGPAVAMITALHERQISVDFLMILAALGAAVIGDATEGAILLFLFSLSGTLEAYAMYRTTHSIEALIRLRPNEATRVRDDGEARVAIEALAIEDHVRVRPGERFPIDGEVLEGETWADESTITGESVPRHKGIGDLVFAGTINGRGSVLVRMTRAVADTTLEQIIRLVREAQAEKTTTQTFLESWQRPYVLSVLAGSGLTFIGALLLHTQSIHDAFYHAMVLLVVVSPCALVVSSPAAVLSAIARAAQQGVLFKGGYHLEMLSRVEIMAFDKTGTITEGKPRVITTWSSDPADADRMLRLAAAVEGPSEHHLAEAIVDEARRLQISLPEVEDFESHTGLGVHARVEGRWVGVGREGLFAVHDIPVPPLVREAARRFHEQGQTALLVVAAPEGPSGVLVLADQVRPDAPLALATLKQLGIQKNILLTGDHERVARSVATQVQADDVRAGLLPDQKVLELRRLMAAGHCLAMVGDGINDAPALASAQVGIAMGGAGTDVALEVADVVLMRDDLTALPFAVWLSRRTRQHVQQNMTFALGVIGLLAISSFLGLPLWVGVIGHEGSTLLVILNGLRLLWEKPDSGEMTTIGK